MERVDREKSQITTLQLELLVVKNIDDIKTCKLLIKKQENRVIQGSSREIKKVSDNIKLTMWDS